MGLNDTPVSERIQIAFFGCTNAGKSSLINAFTGQDVSVVSEKKGTTTDPVLKTMELGDLGPVAVIDTPGLGDDTDIGHLRVKRTQEIFARADIAVVVIDANDILETSNDSHDDSAAKEDALKRLELVKEFQGKCRQAGKPYVTAINKSEGAALKAAEVFISESGEGNTVLVSTLEHTGINDLKEAVIAVGEDVKKNRSKRLMVSDLISTGDSVVLVIPIDESAPKGRLILPQQQVIRDILEAGGNAVCIRDTELAEYFGEDGSRPRGSSDWVAEDSRSKGALSDAAESSRSSSIGSSEDRATDKHPPRLVITDSQVFKEVDEIVPTDIPLTSFSIIMARYKGTLKDQVDGAKVIDTLADGDTVLVAEGCTHHRHCEDIGTVKLPRLLRRYTGKDINIETSSGHGYPDDLSKFKLILHCGGCMLNEQEMQSRMAYAKNQNVPITNYGIAIAYMNGILKRSVAPLPEID